MVGENKSVSSSGCSIASLNIVLKSLKEVGFLLKIYLKKDMILDIIMEMFLVMKLFLSLEKD